MSENAWKRSAQIGITIQFLALVRILGEYFRLKYLQGPAFTLVTGEPFVITALITALLAWLAVSLYFFGRYRLTLGIACSTVVVLLLYKFLVMG